MFKRVKKILSLCLTLCLVVTQVFVFNGASAATVKQYKRISGSDRYKTAVEISKNGWAVSQYAVLARGDDFPDALCAGPLAKKYNAPILLTQTDELNSDVLTELKRLGVETVFITGGPGAVSVNVENTLKSSNIKVERIYGADRFETSVKIAEKLGTVKKLVLATGLNFPDALSISAIASNLGMPILLTEKNSMPDKVKQYVTNMQPEKIYIIGGIGVIGDEVKNLFSGSVRIGGNDRFETNTLVMQEFINELDFNSIYVAVGDGPSGDEFADALSGAVLASKASAPIVLSYKTLPVGTGNFIKSKVKLATKVTALGGEGAVPSVVVDKIVEYINAVPVKVTYDKAGTYGPATGTETISGNVVISVPDVILQNVTIEGDLLLAEGIGNGNATLNNVTVKGTTIVRGGGPNSVIFYNFNGQTVTVDVPDGSNVRIVTEGSTDIGALDIVIPQGAVVTLDGDFGEVNVDSSGAQVNVQNGTIGNLNIGASGVQVGVLSGTVTSLNVGEGTEGSGVDISSGARVTTLEAGAPVDVTGKGTITTANIQSDGVVIAQTPTNTHVDDGLTANVGGEIVNGTPQAGPVSGGDTRPTVSVSGVSVSNATSVTFSSDAAPTTVKWNGTDVRSSMAGSNPYTITVPSITKTANTLVIGASGYHARTVAVTITTSIGNLKLITNVTELSAAIVSQDNGQSWIIKSGIYDLPKNKIYDVQGLDEEWYFPIHKSIIISGEGNPTLTSTTYSANGVWASQNFITVFADDVTIDGLKIKTKEEANKAIEVLGKNFNLKNTDLIVNAEGTSGLVYFNPANTLGQTKDMGAIVIENVNITKGDISYRDNSWGSGAMSGTLLFKDVTIDNTNYGIPFNYGAVTNPSNPNAGITSVNLAVTSQNLLIKLDNAYDVGYFNAFFAILKPGTTVELAPGTYCVSIDLAVPGGVTLDKSKATILVGNVMTAEPGEIASTIYNLKANDILLLKEGTYTISDQAYLFENNIRIIGAGIDKTFINVQNTKNGWGITISGALNPPKLATNAYLEGFTIRRGIDSGTNNVIKVNADNATLKNIKIIGGKGLDINPSKNTVIDGVTVENSIGASIAISGGSTVTIKNTTTTNGAWGSIGVMENGEKSQVIIGEGNVFNEGALYSEKYSVKGIQITGLSSEWTSFVNERDQLVYVKQLPQGAYITTVGVTKGYTTIKAAITAAVTGDTINIAAGTYNEAIVVNKDINIIGFGNVILVGPTDYNNIQTIDKIGAETKNYNAFISVVNANANISNINIVGNPEKASLVNNLTHYNRYLGIAVINSSVVLDNVDIKDITYKDNLKGMQNGVGIYAVAADANKTLTVTNSEISNFNKGAAVIRTSVASATFTNNTITGFGTQGAIAQNGIQYSCLVTITGNSISELIYDPNPTNSDAHCSVGIYGVSSPEGNTINNNTFTNVDLNTFNE